MRSLMTASDFSYALQVVVEPVRPTMKYASF
jgi:hypothetical protein